MARHSVNSTSTFTGALPKMTISSIMKMNKAVRDKILSPELIDKINMEAKTHRPADGNMVFND
jgi:hypothetical protein